VTMAPAENPMRPTLSGERPPLRCMLANHFEGLNSVGNAYLPASSMFIPAGCLPEAFP